MKKVRIVLALVLCFGGATAIAPSLAAAGPLPSGTGIAIGQRVLDVDRIEAMLGDPQVIEALQRAGTDAETFRGRLEELSDHDVHQLAGRMHEIKGGGLIVELLIVVLLVLLILYFAKRL